MDKSRQVALANAFAALHRKGSPLILFNVWDAAGATVVARAGAAAIATSSFAVAVAHGAKDGENLPRGDLIATVRRIAGAVELPVTADVEAGYGASPEAVADTASHVIAAGGVGLNLEDQIIGANALFSADDQAARIAAARAAAERLGIPLFINARTDVFAKKKPEELAGLVDAAIARGRAYAKAGASGFFVPWLTEPALVARVAAEVPLPVNVLAGPHSPSVAELTAAGVSRISLGVWPFFDAMVKLEAAAKDYFATGVFGMA